MNKAIFLDRDGVINELIYYPGQGIIDSPFTVEQFKLLPDVAKAINIFHKLGFEVIIASNQPGIAKGHMSQETFDKIREKMNHELAKEGAFLDGEYYCFHHPEAKVERLRANCECRKPKPGLLLQAAREMDIDLSQSWMIGDGLTDVKAGKSGGCRTMLLGKMKCELCHLMDEMDAHPDFIAFNLSEAAQKIVRVMNLELVESPAGRMSVDVDYLRNRSAELRDVLGELARLTSKPYHRVSLDEKYSLRYQVVVLAEALGSMCLHIAIEDFGLEPKSYGECFKFLEDKKIITMADELVKVTRLRNLLVHRYWVTDNARVYEETKGSLEHIEKIISRLEGKYGL